MPFKTSYNKNSEEDSEWNTNTGNTFEFDIGVSHYYCLQCRWKNFCSWDSLLQHTRALHDNGEIYRLCKRCKGLACMCKNKHKSYTSALEELKHFYKYHKFFP